MKRVTILSLTLVTLLVNGSAWADTPPPTVTSIEPAAAPSSGGTNVTITGANLSIPPNFACFVPCPTTVTFGDITVAAKEETNTRIVVVAPAHAAGRVDLTIRTGDARSITIPDAFTFTAGAEDSWQKILLPVYLDGTVSGSNGSQWKSDFWLRNNSSGPIALAPWPCETDACPAIFPPQTIVNGEQTLHGLAAFFRAPSANPTRLLYIPRDKAAGVSFGLRIADISRAALNAGTEIPVVRDSQFRSGTVTLHNVPFDSRFRLMLRVNEMAYTSARFRVSTFAEQAGGAGELLNTVELTATTTESGDFRSQAAYASYTWDELLQQPRTFPNAVRVEITPLTAGSKFWPFVSITNNDTQMVTLVTPQ
ncbi:MAG TPA: IPT/TIG domain-containing protein [Thermoanaerobaculia bacterium]|nr:IPT/TIG domain-containing protein [Thermoanaerobaculia bacterium]